MKIRTLQNHLEFLKWQYSHNFFSLASKWKTNDTLFYPTFKVLYSEVPWFFFMSNKKKHAPLWRSELYQITLKCQKDKIAITFFCLKMKKGHFILFNFQTIGDQIKQFWPLCKIWACARRHIACMNASLHAQVISCAQRGMAWSSIP